MTVGEAVRRGQRVHLRHPLLDDRDGFLTAVARSRRLHRPWVFPPTDDDAFSAMVHSADRPDQQRFLVCRNDIGDVVGVTNLSQIFHGPFRNAYLGYYAFVPYDGEGLLREGVQLTVRHAFTQLRLHRVQADVQPGNDRSIAMLRSLGFTEEGYARRYLKIGGAWRDHLMFALLADDR